MTKSSNIQLLLQCRKNALLLRYSLPIERTHEQSLTNKFFVCGTRVTHQLKALINNGCSFIKITLNFKLLYCEKLFSGI